MTLAELKVGQDAVLRTIGGQGELRHHLLDMGLTPRHRSHLAQGRTDGRPYRGGAAWV